MQDPGYPPGISEKDISYDDPDPCEDCDGEGELEKTPCCEVKFLRHNEEDIWLCEKCSARFEDKKCETCKGEGVVYEF